jgi:hypothetical protein
MHSMSSCTYQKFTWIEITPNGTQVSSSSSVVQACTPRTRRDARARAPQQRQTVTNFCVLFRKTDHLMQTRKMMACGVYVNRYDNITRHKAACDVCSPHMNHKAFKRTFMCDVCTSIFTRKWSLTRHKKKHVI